MSMTTAPVTAGGSTLCSTPEPRTWMSTPTSGEHEAGDEDRAGDLAGVAALRADRRDTADERRRGAEVARHPALDDEQEAIVAMPLIMIASWGLSPMIEREDEGGAEHRHDVLRPSPTVLPHAEALVRGDDVVRSGEVAVSVQFPTQAQ